MRTALSLSLVVVTTSLLAACNKPSAAPASPAPAEKVEAKAAAAPEAKLATSRALAMAKLPGDAGVDRVIANLQRSVEKNPAKVDFWILLGRAWVRKARESSDPGFYVNANACAEIALEVSPDDKLAYDLQGLVLLNDHKFREAADLASKVIAKHPDDAMAYGSLSDALLELGRFEEAADAAQKMMDLKPNLPSYSRASYFRWLAGDEKAALEYARLAIDSGRDPKDPEPRAWELVQAAMIFWHKGDLDGADAGFTRALDGMTEYPPALVGRGRVAPPSARRSSFSARTIRARSPRRRGSSATRGRRRVMKRARAPRSRSWKRTDAAVTRARWRSSSRRRTKTRRKRSRSRPRR